MFIVLARLSVRMILSEILDAIFSSFNKPVIPKPIKIRPNQYPNTIEVIPAMIKITLIMLTVVLLIFVLRNK